MRKKIIGMPKIVCLCGSTRFIKAFVKANKDETMQGNIVLLPGVYSYVSEEFHGEKISCTESEMNMLKQLHKKKIDLCDELLVLNVDGYIGEDTQKEIEYTLDNKKMVRYLEDCE